MDSPYEYTVIGCLIHHMARSVVPVRVLRLRIKDKHAPDLSLMAREVNFVWNYCNELSLKIFLRERRFASGIELCSAT